MRRKKQKKINFIQVIWDFLKLQVAANILFVSTLMGFLIGDKVLHTPQLPTLIVASIIGNILFFIIDRDWLFTKKGAKYGKWAIQKFIIFMSLNFVLNILLIEFFGWVLRTTPDASHTIILFTIWDFATGWIGPFIGSNLSNNWEMYVAQFLSGFVFAGWSFVGLKFWVFAPIRQHAKVSRNHAITTRRPNRQRNNISKNRTKKSK